MFRIPVVLHVPKTPIVLAFAEARIGAAMGKEGCADGSVCCACVCVRV